MSGSASPESGANVQRTVSIPQNPETVKVTIPDVDATCTAGYGRPAEVKGNGSNSAARVSELAATFGASTSW